MCFYWAQCFDTDGIRFLALVYVYAGVDAEHRCEVSVLVPGRVWAADGKLTHLALDGQAIP